MNYGMNNDRHCCLLGCVCNTEHGSSIRVLCLQAEFAVCCNKATSWKKNSNAHRAETLSTRHSIAVPSNHVRKLHVDFKSLCTEGARLEKRQAPKHREQQKPQRNGAATFFYFPNSRCEKQNARKRQRSER